MIRNHLSFKNCIRKPGRTAALLVLVMVLSFSIFAGCLVITGLRGGLASLETRLGADIMVVPYEAASKSELSNMILQGNPGYFYMNRQTAEKIEGIEGISEVSEQFFLASASSGCCSYKVQIIGFDPETDFTISPWVKLSDKEETLGDLEVYVGNSLNAFKGDELMFYGTTVRVAGKLDETGTYLDTAVYANKETVQTLIQSAKESKLYDFGDISPTDVVSSVLINVADGYSVDEVLDDINIHVRGVEAVKTQSMISDVAGKLTGISDLTGVMIVVVWILVFIILILAFVMIANERKKEFAVLRVIGASRKKLAGIIFGETMLIGFAGSLIGTVAALLIGFAFQGAVENMLALPFLMIRGRELVLLSAAVILICMLTASAAAAFCTFRIVRNDAAIILRGES